MIASIILWNWLQYFQYYSLMFEFKHLGSIYIIRLFRCCTDRAYCAINSIGDKLFSFITLYQYQDHHHLMHPSELFPKCIARPVSIKV